MSYVNQIQDKEQETHDIHDKRLTVSIEDVGKVVGVNEDGQLALLEVSGGTKLYQHFIVTDYYISGSGDSGERLAFLVTNASSESIIESEASSTFTNFRVMLYSRSVDVKVGYCRFGSWSQPLINMLYINAYSQTARAMNISMIKYDTTQNEFAYVTFENVAIVSDTVTPL